MNDNRLHPWIHPIGRGWIGWLIVLVAAMALYGFTLAPDLVWQDQGDYQLQVAQCNLNRPGDLVRVHPFFIVTAHAIGRMGWFSYAYAANLTSAVFAAIAVANVFLVTYRLTGQVGPGILSAGTFGMAHSVWFLGVQAQTYSMANAAISGGILLFLEYLLTNKGSALVWMGLVFGLGISAHNISQIAFAVIVLWLFVRIVAGRLNIAVLGSVIAAWFVGAGLLWMVAAGEYQRSGDLWRTILSALWGKWGQEVLNIDKLPLLLKRSGMFFVLNFPTPLVVLTGPGVMWSLRQENRYNTGWLLLILTGLYALFAMRYDVPNQNNFFLPMYMMISVYIGLGFSRWAQNRPGLRTAVACILLAAIPAAYPTIAERAQARKMDLGTRRHIPYRDEYRYYLIPWQHDQIGPRRLVAELAERLPRNAIVLADMTTIPALLYAQQIERIREDLRILNTDTPIEDLYPLLSYPDIRLFTLSDVVGYRPRWAAGLTPFILSDSEQIWEIPRPLMIPN